MISLLLLVFLTIFISPIVVSYHPSLTIQCDDDNFSIVNSSSDTIKLFNHVHQLVLEDCPLERIPDILSNIQPKVTQISSLILKRMKHHPLKTFPNHYQCSYNLQSVVRVKLCDTPASAAGHYSAVLAYLSQCTSVGDLEILDTSLRQVMRLQESGETLQSLRLTNNHIAELQLESFSGLSKLRVLDLGSNKLVRIPSGVFRSNRRLRRLYLARNVISFITRQSFLGRIHLYLYCLSSYFTVFIVLTTSIYIFVQLTYFD